VASGCSRGEGCRREAEAQEGAEKVNWYNGFSPKERNAASAIFTAAWRAGRVTLEHRCTMCGLRGTIKGTTGGHLMTHYEDYRRPLEPIVLCVECHLRLHSRFRCPNRWKLHCLRVRSENATPYPTVGAYFGATKAQYHDTGPVALTPDPSRWWEVASMDAALGREPARGIRIVLAYAPGRDGDVNAFTATVLRDEAAAADMRLL
jgi:hypothetical protein